MRGGWIANLGQINELQYHDGSYSPAFFGQTGTIGKLIIYGRLFASIDWGIVEEVVFAAGGRGTLVIPVRVNCPCRRSSRYR